MKRGEKTTENQQRLEQTRQYWDQEAARFDDEPDHGLHDPAVLQAWTDLVHRVLPFQRGAILDIGCGTGSLSIVLAGLGHEVNGIDLSPEMISLARAKAHRSGYPIHFQIMDAAFPQFPKLRFDALICRHLLWALPEPAQVLQRWAGLLNPSGRMLLIEGYWHTGGGLHAEEIVEMLPPSLALVSLQNLSDQPVLWGGPVTDERYAVLARRVNSP